MFTEIHLENYKSFSEITMDLTQKNGAPKNLVLLYGENGAGKSNLAAAFFTLAETIRTMDIRDFLQDIMAQDRRIAENEQLLKMLRSQLRDMEAIIQDARAIGAAGNLVLDFSFVIANKKGRYLLEMDDRNLVHEKLEYTLEKNRGVYFDITPGDFKVNEKIFTDKSFLHDIQENLAKFWGKHSLLAILQHEKGDKIRRYLDEAISRPFRHLLEDFLQISCRVKCPGAPERGIVGLTHPILSQLTKGTLRPDRTQELERAEAMLDRILPQINRDIQNVYYQREKRENGISYELYTSQMISGRLCDIPFQLESTGTQSLLELLPFFLAAAAGAVVVIDELDTGIHDACVRDLLLSIQSELTGQMIVTTHNTLLMDSDLSVGAFFVIQKQENGVRHIDCITETVSRVHPNHNVQNRYLRGDYGGIPAHMNVSLHDLLQILGQGSSESDGLPKVLDGETDL